MLHRRLCPRFPHARWTRLESAPAPLCSAEQLKIVYVKPSVHLMCNKIHVKFDKQFTQHVKIKVKFSHTRYRALGPELIPVYRQSARR